MQRFDEGYENLTPVEQGGDYYCRCYVALMRAQNEI